MQKLVTHFSLRLGLELLGKENCIGFHLILSDCKVRNPQNLAGYVPNVPTDTQHSAEIWSEATSPPLSKGDLGGMSILNHKEEEQRFLLLFLCQDVS